MRNPLSILFGCSHGRTTFPLTPSRRVSNPSARGTYVACLDCGKEFEYNWREMRIGAAREGSQPDTAGHLAEAAR